MGGWVKKYTIVDTEEKLESLDRYLLTDNKPNFELMAIDTETNGLKHYQDVIIGFSLSVDETSGFYIPLLSWIPAEDSLKTRSVDKIKIQSYMDGQFVDIWGGKMFLENVNQIQYQPPATIIEYAKKWFTSGSQLLLHNALFDAAMISANFGFDIAPWIFCDTMLLHHTLDENSPHGLKEIALQYSEQLGFDAQQDADAERTELGSTILKNGGTYNTRTKHVWRGDYEYLGKYAISDTILTYKIFLYLITKLDMKLYHWFFAEEVMPLCREVLIPMKLTGVPVNIKYFQDLEKEVADELEKIEDELINELNSRELLGGFDIGNSMEAEVPKKAFVEKIMELEGLEYPTIEIRNQPKPSLAKKALENAKAKNPHWLWDYLTGDDEIRYSDRKQQDILKSLYFQRTNRRYRFNVNSDMHLRWLFCDKLKHAKEKLPQTESATPANPIPSMKSEVLQDVFSEKYPWVNLILKYKKVHKLWSTYIKGILEREHNGVLYTSFMQHGTVSGRFASRNPNLQNLPRAENLEYCEKCESANVQIRKICSAIADMQCKDCGYTQKDIILSSIIKRGFIAPEGHKIINADFDALEAKIFSFMSGSPKLKDLWARGEDLYSRVYIDIFEETKYSANPKDPNYLKTLNPSARTRIKPVVLGVTYGSKAGQVANLMDLHIKKKIKQKNGAFIEMDVLDYAEGDRIIRKYLEAYPELKDYMQAREYEACTRGWVETIIGRRRNFKYAPYIYRLLMEADMDVSEFLALKKSDLERHFVNRALGKDALYTFAEHFKIEIYKITKGEFTWYSVKNLLKHDLDNAKNFPIQGLAAHITNRAMIEMARELKKANISGYLTLQVHDEISGVVRKDQVAEAKKIWQDCMERNLYARKLDILMGAKPVSCDNLAGGK
jgi:DNA polymerase I-like protein with 3'-5' exonuclease and polymerase domains